MFLEIADSTEAPRGAGAKVCRIRGDMRELIPQIAVVAIGYIFLSVLVLA